MAGSGHRLRQCGARRAIKPLGRLLEFGPWIRSRSPDAACRPGDGGPGCRPGRRRGARSGSGRRTQCLRLYGGEGRVGLGEAPGTGRGGTASGCGGSGSGRKDRAVCRRRIGGSGSGGAFGRISGPAAASGGEPLAVGGPGSQSGRAPGSGRDLFGPRRQRVHRLAGLLEPERTVVRDPTRPLWPRSTPGGSAPETWTGTAGPSWW